MMTLEPTRRNTHNAPPDLRRKIARPSSNRLSHMHLSLADRYLGEPDYGLVGYRKLEHNLHVGRTKFYLNPSKEDGRVIFRRKSGGALCVSRRVVGRKPVQAKSARFVPADRPSVKEIRAVNDERREQPKQSARLGR